MPFYEKGPTRIYYEEAGSGFPPANHPRWRTQWHRAIHADGIALQPYGKVQRRLPVHLC